MSEYKYVLLHNLYQRIKEDSKIVITKMEKEAFETALSFLQNHWNIDNFSESDSLQQINLSGHSNIENRDQFAEKISKEIKLNDSILSKDVDEKFIVGIDFGTSESKAWATNDDENMVLLALGNIVGEEGYSISSNMLIHDGKLYFGKEAEKIAEENNLELITSLKKYFIDYPNSNLEEKISDIPIAHLFYLFMGYLIYTSMEALSKCEGYDDDAFYKMRITHPVYDTNVQEEKKEKLQKIFTCGYMLRDTFKKNNISWKGGVQLSDANNIFEQLENKQDIKDIECLSEPVASISSIQNGTGRNRMVVDFGAGSIDLGGYSGLGEKLTSIDTQYLNKAGDEIDSILSKIIFDKYNFNDNAEKRIQNNIRDLKEKLLKESELCVSSDGTYVQDALSSALEQGDNDEISVKKEELLSDPDMDIFKKKFIGICGSVFDKIKESYYYENERIVHLLISGGGRHLPFLKDWIEEACKYEFKEINDPEYVKEYQLDEHYPILAVAIGASVYDTKQDASI